MPGSSDQDYDPQDQAEALDESMMSGGEGSVGLGGDSPFGVGAEMRTFEELPDVLDMTQMAGDRDDDEALALDADEFDEDAIDDGDLEDDDELDYHAATQERQDDLDGLGAEAGSEGIDEDLIDDPDNIEGLDEIGDAETVEGGEDDVTDYQARNVGDADLKAMGYAEDREGVTRARPDPD